MSAVVLVMAKAPVAGFAKTRLAPAVGERHAARLAAAALLDTMDCVREVPETQAVCALTGELAASERARELVAALRDYVVLPQRGEDFANRLANAHADVARYFPGERVLQVGMDTPQLSPALLTAALTRLDEYDAVLGPAADGGWWALGLRRPADAHVLRTVPMSLPTTGDATLSALRGLGLRVGTLPVLSDVDTVVDAAGVAAQVPASRFARAFREAV